MLYYRCMTEIMLRGLTGNLPPSLKPWMLRELYVWEMLCWMCRQIIVWISTLKSPKLSLFYCVNIFVRMCTPYSLHLILQELHKETSTLSKHGSVFCEERSFSFSDVFLIELIYLIMRWTITLKYFYWHQCYHLVLSFTFLKYLSSALCPSSKTTCIESSALCSLQFWSSYNGAQNFIRKHAVDAKRIFISLALVSYVEMEVQGDLCVLHGLLRTV